MGTPWVGAVDVQSYYFDRYSGDGERGRTACSPSSYSQASRQRHSSPQRPASGPPALPGYEVGAAGFLQLVVKNEVAALKVFLVQYDLTKLVPGGKLLVRERGYQAVPATSEELGTSPGSQSPGRRREVLRYAVELQFTCVAVNRKARRSTSQDRGEEEADVKRRRKDAAGSAGNKAYFLTKQIRVVFPTAGVSGSGASGRTDKVRDDEDIRTDRFVEVMNPSRDGDNDDDDDASTRSRRLSMGSFTGWDDIRGRWQQEKKKVAAVAAHRPPALSFERIATPPPLAIKSPSLLTAELEHSPNLEPSALPAMDGFAPGATRPLRMGDQDSERLLSESLQRLRAGS